MSHHCSYCGSKAHNVRTCSLRKTTELMKDAGSSPFVPESKEKKMVVREVKEKKLDVWELTESVLPHARLVLLYGPPGTGKTTIANNFGNPKEVYNITLTEETPAAELRGHFVPRGHEFIWMDGPALTAFKDGCRLVLNEIDKASGDALTFCHALLDDPGIARITLPYKNEKGKPVTIHPHEGFNVIATMNGEPDDLPDALRDRFSIRINIEQIHPNAINSLPEDLRKAARGGISRDGSRSVSVRAWMVFAMLREHIGEDNASLAVFGDRAETILNTIRIDRVRSGKTLSTDAYELEKAEAKKKEKTKALYRCLVGISGREEIVGYSDFKPMIGSRDDIIRFFESFSIEHPDARYYLLESAGDSHMIVARFIGGTFKKLNWSILELFDHEIGFGIKGFEKKIEKELSSPSEACDYIPLGHLDLDEGEDDEDIPF